MIVLIDWMNRLPRRGWAFLTYPGHAGSDNVALVVRPGLLLEPHDGDLVSLAELWRISVGLLRKTVTTLMHAGGLSVQLSPELTVACG